MLPAQAQLSEHSLTNQLQIIRAAGIQHRPLPGLQLCQGIGWLQPHHGISRDRSCCFVLQPLGQITAGVAKALITGKRRVMQRLTMQKVHAISSNAPPLREGWHQHIRGKGPQLSADHLQLERRVPAQGGVAAAHHQPRPCQLREQRLEAPAQGRELLAHLLGLQGTAVGQQKQQR